MKNLNQEKDGINGGFFVLNAKAIDYISDDNISWEKEPLEGLAKDGSDDGISAFWLLVLHGYVERKKYVRRAMEYKKGSMESLERIKTCKTIINVTIKSIDMEIVGLIPAAGQGSRIGPLPCSKELYPVGFGSFPGKQGMWPKASCQYVLDKMRLAGIRKVFFVLREGKWDIPSFLGDGQNSGMHIAYLMRNLPYGVPFTLDQAYPFLEDKMVALGWPDIILQGENEYQQLVDCQNVTNADVVLGLFPADRPEKVDMVELDDRGRVKEIVIKPKKTRLRLYLGNGDMDAGI